MNEDTIENFFGVYLLYCKNPKFKGRNYIGYTVDPNRRIKQHNKGKHAGGAWRTSNRGPWSMVLIVHGFPNDVAALRFEWAWQHPLRSRRLRHLPKKGYREKVYDYNLRILSEMLQVGPWNRLPLTVRWLDEELMKDFPVLKHPPLHMPLVVGPVVSKKLPKSQALPKEGVGQEILDKCYMCKDFIEGRKMHCLDNTCDLVCHIICLSKCYKENQCENIPVSGNCPKCNGNFLWGDLVRKLKGCYNNANIVINTETGNEFYGSDSE